MRRLRRAVDRVSTISTERSRAVKLSSPTARSALSATSPEPAAPPRRWRCIMKVRRSRSASTPATCSTSPSRSRARAPVRHGRCGIAHDRARRGRSERPLCPDADARLTTGEEGEGTGRAPEREALPRSAQRLRIIHSGDRDPRCRLQLKPSIVLSRRPIAGWRSCGCRSRISAATGRRVSSRWTAGGADRPNGAGKTKLLEALSFLAPGRGLRRARLGEIDRRAAAAALRRRWRLWRRLVAPLGSRLCAASCGARPRQRAWQLLGRSGGRHRPRPEIASEAARDRRLVRIDGVAVKGQAALAEL